MAPPFVITFTHYLACLSEKCHWTRGESWSVCPTSIGNNYGIESWTWEISQFSKRVNCLARIFNPCIIMKISEYLSDPKSGPGPQGYSLRILFWMPWGLQLLSELCTFLWFCKPNHIWGTEGRSSVIYASDCHPISLYPQYLGHCLPST